MIAEAEGWGGATHVIEGELAPHARPTIGWRKTARLASERVRVVAPLVARSQISRPVPELRNLDRRALQLLDGREIKMPLKYRFLTSVQVRVLFRIRVYDAHPTQPDLLDSAIASPTNAREAQIHAIPDRN